MDEAPESEEGRVRGGTQLSEEARVNALVLLAWSASPLLRHHCQHCLQVAMFLQGSLQNLDATT